MNTTGSSIRMAKATRYLISSTKKLFNSLTGKDKKMIVFHPILPQEQKKFHVDRYIDDYQFPYQDYDVVFNTNRRHITRFAFLMFVICFGIGDLLTRVAYDQSFSYKYYLQYPEEMYIVDCILDKYREVRNKYFNYLGDKVLSDYDYNIKKQELVDGITGRKEREAKKKQEEKQTQLELKKADRYVKKFEEMVEDKS